MWFHATRYQSTAVGGRRVDVRCDQCGCAYHYELTRIGSGSSASVYGIGGGAAQRSAAKGSQTDLAKRLQSEAELVPCPKCHWIGDDMVRGYRLGRYRALGTLALYVGVVGVCASLIVAWFVAKGPVNDRPAVPKILLIGPLISVAAAGAIVLIRTLLRGRIQPNARYPNPPVLPLGSPPALMDEPPSGGEPVPQPALATTADGHWIVFQVGRDTLPSVCCECMAPVMPKTGYPIIVVPGLQITIPFCDSCSSRRKRSNRLVGFGVFLLVLAISLATVMAMHLGHDAFWMLLIAAVLISPFVGAAVAHERAKPARMAVADASRGVVRLRFRNDDYRRRVVPKT